MSCADEDIMSLYENAYRLAPKNEELANHWFMAIVRADERKGMQQVRISDTYCYSIQYNKSGRHVSGCYEATEAV